jgi:hypothetical protein
MQKKTIVVKDQKLKKILKKGGRKDAKKDFFELVRRSASPE